jgi:hypothetical protein
MFTPMSEAIPDNVDFGFIAGRLDTVQKDQADMRRRVIETNTKIDRLTTRVGDIEQQINGVTERMDHVVDRISKLETGMTEVLFHLRRMDSSTGKPFLKT